MNDKRLHRLQAWLSQNDITFAYISHPKNVFYFSGFKCEPHERLLGLVIFPKSEPLIICPAMEADQAKSSGWAHQVIGYQDHEDPWDALKSAFKQRDLTGHAKAIIETDYLSFARVQKLESMFTQLTIDAAEPMIEQMRMVKDPEELVHLRKAAELADFAIQTGVEAIKKGRTEQAIIAEIEYELTKRGYPEMAFSTMVLTGEKTAMPHGHPGERQIKEGDFVMFDLGVVVNGYCSDITRTFIYKHATEKQKAIYETVLNAQQQSIAQCTIEQPMNQLDRTARQVITDAGYGDYFPHRVGHGLGLDAHEAPSLSDANKNQLGEGMLITIEPGIYVPDIGGVRIEDDVHIGPDGPECLTKYPKSLTVID